MAAERKETRKKEEGENEEGQGPDSGEKGKRWKKSGVSLGEHGRAGERE